MAADQAQRTEKPTGKRLAQAREKGNVPRTKELPAALGLLGIVVYGKLFGLGWIDRLTDTCRELLAGVHRPDLTTDSTVALSVSVLSSLGMLLVAPLGVMVVAGVGGQLVQGAPLWTLKPLTPDFGRLNPISGLKKIFRLRNWVEMSKSFLKMTLFSAIAVAAVFEAMDGGLPGGRDAAGTLLAVLTLAGKVTLRVGALALVLALFDLLYTRYDYTRSLRMTKQEVKEEQREQDGDPLVKSRVRSKQMSLARSRMMADVPKATVVVTNPTHFAVALRYAPGETDVPVVLAKGRGHLAAKIREVATAHRVPIHRDPPLARSLYRSVPVGGVIPAALFKAVAEVLALVLGKRRSR